MVRALVRRRWIFAALLAIIVAVSVLIPRVSYTEDNDTLLLARVIYAMGRSESYATKLAIGSVVMNRVDDAWFADDLGSVLREQQQFPAGTRYDEDSLRAAHDVISGKRTVGRNALYIQATDATEVWDDAYLVNTMGCYGFYSAAKC